MSSCGNPNTEADALMTKRPKYDRHKACVKCKLKSGNIVIRHAVYCKECFFPLISLRFRRTLEPHINPTPELHRRKGLRASGNLLVGLSGGLGSTVLLDLVHKTYLSPRERQEGDQNPNGGCPWTKIFIAYVDASGVLAGAQDESHHVEHLVKSYGTKFEFLGLKLEDAFSQKWLRSAGVQAPNHHNMGLNIINEDILLKFLSSDSASPSSSLRAYIESLPTQTAIASAIQSLIRVLLLYAAASTQSSHLLLGTSLTALSISLISSISQGGGYSVREEAQEEWTYRNQANAEQTVRVVRPLRDVGMKECAFWAWWCSLKVFGKHRYSGGRQDISALTREFIIGLEKDYPSTVSTIARTCGKLTTKEDTSTKCLFCQRPAQPGTQEWKQKISIRSYGDFNPGDLLPSHINLDAGACNSQQCSHPDSIMGNMCYACHTSWTSKSIRGSTVEQMEVPVPSWVSALGTDGETKRMSTNTMRNMIENFLLDPDS